MGGGWPPSVAGHIQATLPGSEEGWAEGGLLGGWTYTGHTTPLLPDVTGAVSYLIALLLPPSMWGARRPCWAGGGPLGGWTHTGHTNEVG